MQEKPAPTCLRKETVPPSYGRKEGRTAHCRIQEKASSHSFKEEKASTVIYREEAIPYVYRKISVNLDLKRRDN